MRLAQGLPVRVVIRLAAGDACCLACRGGWHQVAYRLHSADAAGAIACHGVDFCPQCAEQLGLTLASLMALDATERHLLASALGVGRVWARAIRLEFSHLRGLVASGQLESPPDIPASCFATWRRGESWGQSMGTHSLSLAFPS